MIEHNTFDTLVGPMQKAAKEFSRLGGILHCPECMSTIDLEEIYIPNALANGWPLCCGYNMRWLTAKQLKEAGNGESRTSK